jgi:hypothetical protein
MNGKIYVFGGYRETLKAFITPYGVGRVLPGVMCGSEVYDPRSNKWSTIAPMKFARYCHDVAIMGEEIVVYGRHLVDVSNHHQANYSANADFLEVYHPGKDEWRVVDGFVRKIKDSYAERGLAQPALSAQQLLQGISRRGDQRVAGMKGLLFMTQGKAYFMNDENILVHNFDAQAWTDLHSHSLPAVENTSGYPEQYSDNNLPYLLLAVDNELLALVEYPRRDDPDYYFGSPCEGSKLIRCRGLSSENKEIAWRVVRKWLGTCPIQLMCPIKL